MPKKAHYAYSRQQPKPRRKQAVALGYDTNNDSAPRVLASGSGKTAEQIIALANAHNVIIREDPILVEALSKVELGAVIPPELYLVIAEILAYVFRIQERHFSSAPETNRTGQQDSHADQSRNPSS